MPRTRSLCLSILPCLVALPSICFGQLAAVGWANVQFTDSVGRVIPGGKVYTCIAGASCPGTQLATYTTSSGSTQHQNPITLDAAGRPPGGMIWLTANAAYRFVVTDALGAVVPSAGGDNLMGGSGGGGGGGGGNFWTLTANDITNTNTGNVLTLSNFTVGANATVTGTLNFKDSQATPHYAGFKASASTANVTWALPTADAHGCLVSDGAGNLSIDASCTASTTSGIWAVTSNNVTLSSGAYTVATLPIKNQTASTGVTSVTISAGAGQGSNNLTEWRDSLGNLNAWVNPAGQVNATSAVIATISALQGLVWGPSYASALRNDGSILSQTLAGSGVQCLQASNTGVISLAGGPCGTGGGGGLPVTDTTSIAYKNGDPTALMRLDLSSVSGSSVRVLKMPDSSFTLAGQNMTNTFTYPQIFQGQAQFYNGVSGPQWSISSDTANYLDFRNSSSLLRMYLVDNGFPPIGGSGANLVGPSALFQATATNSPSLMAEGVGGQTADIFQVEAASLAAKYFWVDSAGGTHISNCVSGCSPGGSGTVTQVNTAFPLAGGPITQAGTISCSACITTGGGQTINGNLTLSGQLISNSISTQTISSVQGLSWGPSFGYALQNDGSVTALQYKVAGQTVINTSGVLSNSFGVDVNAGVAAIGFNIHGGSPGISHTSNLTNSVGGACQEIHQGGVLIFSSC